MSIFEGIIGGPLVRLPTKSYTSPKLRKKKGGGVKNAPPFNPPSCTHIMVHTNPSMYVYTEEAAHETCVDLCGVCGVKRHAYIVSHSLLFLGCFFSSSPLLVFCHFPDPVHNPLVTFLFLSYFFSLIIYEVSLLLLFVYLVFSLRCRRLPIFCPHHLHIPFSLHSATTAQ